MVGVAAVEVTTEGDSDLAVAGVVGRIEHKFAQGLELALDAVEVAGGCRRRDELDLVVGCPGADGWRPVERQVVV